MDQDQISAAFKRAIRRRVWAWLDGPDFEARVSAISRTDRLTSYLLVGESDRLRIASDAFVNDALFNVLSGTITIEAAAFFGHRVALLTGTHDISRRGVDRHDAYPRAGRDIMVGRGAWLASNVTVLGPSRIGDNAVVAAGSIVTKDVPPLVIVAGVPAKVIGSVPDVASREANGPGDYQARSDSRDE